MHVIRKLRSVKESEPLERGAIEGHVVGIVPTGEAEFRDGDGQTRHVRIPSHIDRRWLEAAVALAPLPALAMHAEGMRSAVLWCTFPGAKHKSLQEHIKLEAKTIELKAAESVNIVTGRSTITVTADGEVQVRGKNIMSRASNINRIRGGGVRIN
jgi:hypothetical protein